MKTLILLPLLFGLTAAAAGAQTNSNSNAIVACWPTNQPYAGCTNYPSTNSPIWTNSVTLPANYLASTNPIYLLILNADPSVIGAMQGSNNDNYYAGVRQVVADAKTNFDWFRSQFPAGITDTSNRIQTLTNAYAAWISGTNTASGTNNLIKSVIQNDIYTWVYLNQVVHLLSDMMNSMGTTFTNGFPQGR